MSRKRNRTRYKNRRQTAIISAPAPQLALPAAPAAEQGSPLTRVQAVAELLSALDGYSNAAAFLGEDSPLISSGTFRRSGLSNQLELLTTAYRESWLAKRIIDMPCEDMTRAWYSHSTGEADLRNYYDMIAQLQERMLRPALEKLLPIMAISCWGFVPENLEIIFEPVMTTSPAERAELVQKLSSDVIEAFKCGLLNQRQALEELKARGEELGVYTKV